MGFEALPPDILPLLTPEIAVEIAAPIHPAFGGLVHGELDAFCTLLLVI